MRYLLVCLGSAGDLHPFLALARALCAEGHDVELMSNAPYRDAVEREGVRFSALCSERDHERTATHPDLWHPVRGFGVLWRHLAVPAIRPVWERVSAMVEEDARVPPSSAKGWRVLASPLAVGARFVRSSRSFPLASVYTAPANLRPLDDPMFVGPYRVPRWWPRAGRAALWWGLDRWKLEPMARPLLESLAEEWQLAAPPPRGRSIFGEWVHSPDGGIALFPPSFGHPAPPHADAAIQSADFPLFRRADDILSPEVGAFLDADEPPVVGFGGSNPGPEGRRLLQVTWQACRALGKRCLLLGPASAMPKEASNDGRTWMAPHVPLPDVLPRSESFVHHGGIGSCAEGLAAGIPQIVVPFAYDQFDNAARIDRLHAGFTVSGGTGRMAAGLLAALQQAEGMPFSASRPLADPITACLDALRRWEARVAIAPPR